jgi:hypothetical protein
MEFPGLLGLAARLVRAAPTQIGRHARIGVTASWRSDVTVAWRHGGMASAQTHPPFQLVGRGEGWSASLPVGGALSMTGPRQSRPWRDPCGSGHPAFWPPGLSFASFGTTNQRKETTMGLDMYAFATRTAPATPVDFSADESQELAYWRKHPNLHGWMEHLYRAKGGTAEDFNCVNLQLDAADLDALEHAVRSKTLPPTVGFFFGQTDGSEYGEDLAFIARAREALARGEAVYYTSWW